MNKPADIWDDEFSPQDWARLTELAGQHALAEHIPDYMTDPDNWYIKPRVDWLLFWLSFGVWFTAMVSVAVGLAA